MTTSGKGCLALVLSGGGARGAYEVGVLSVLVEELRLAEAIDLVCGTSVGAIHASFFASAMHEPVEGLRELRETWEGLALTDVLGFGVLHARRLHRVLLGGQKGAGLFDAAALRGLIEEGVRWERLAENLRTERLRALTVTATHVPTGRPCCFIDRAAPTGSVALPPTIFVEEARVTPAHVLASAAIPIIFPPVEIGDDLFCDGGLRMNTPLAPALALGASRVLVVGMSAGRPTEPELPKGRYPSAAFLIGKVLDAFLLDHLNLDLEELDRINGFLRDGIAAYGDEFLTRLDEVAAAGGRPRRRLVSSLVLRPSEDIGAMAGDYLRRSPLSKVLGRTLFRLLDAGQGSDLASYLLFDGGFAQELIELGRSDALARRDELVAFVRGEA